MKTFSFLKNLFIIFILFNGFEMNAQVVYTCPDKVNYYCTNDPTIVLHDLGKLPAGGTFTLNNQQVVTQISPLDYPKGATIDIHYVNTSVKPNFVCDFQITIRVVPEVSCPRLLAFCWSLETIYLGNHPDFKPSGGKFSGDFISSDGYFDCRKAGPGEHTITYTVTDTRTGCSNSCKTIVSFSNGEIEGCPENGIRICYAEKIDLAKIAPIKPVGGIYSGDYVKDNFLLAPKPGIYTVAYVYERLQGCDGICIFTVTLNPLPEIECPKDQTICGLDGGALLLPVPKELGWGYQGTGVVLVNGLPYFDPAKAGPGKHKITLTVFNDFKCERTCVFYINVIDLSVECPRQLQVCSNQKTDLTKLWDFNPDGIFSGDFVSAEGIFTAPIVYMPQCTKIKYVLEDTNGCKETCEFQVCIIPYPPVECPKLIEMCEGDSTLQLFGDFPVTFLWKDKIVDPSQLEAGTYEIDLVYVISKEPYCEFTCRFTLIIHPLPQPKCPEDLITCTSEEALILPEPDYPHWEYDGPGIVMIDKKPIFDPNKAGPGKHLITLFMANEFGCKAKCVFTIIVIDFRIECPKELVVCSGKKTDLNTLWNFHPKGTFSGDFLSPDGILEAPLFSENKCIPIEYSLKNETGCETSCTFVVCMLAAPRFECPDTVYLCNDAAPYLPNLGFPFHFFWNGKEIPNGFNPATAGIGTHPVKIEYKADNNLGCTYTCEFIIKVMPKPELKCPNDLSLCSVDQVAVLPPINYPKYFYSGTGVFSKGGSYYFSAPKPGKYLITLTVYDRYGCSSTCTINIVVGDFRLECPKELWVCPDKKTDLTSLWNFDPQGEFFGAHISSEGVFQAPYLPGAKNCHQIKYRIIIDDQCKDSCVFLVCVKEAIPVQCPDTLVVCIDEPPFNPAAGTNALVYFNGIPLPNGFNPVAAGSGTHHITLEFPGNQSDCSSFCTMVIIVHKLPEIECPNDIYLCNPEASVELPTFDPFKFGYKGDGIFFENGKPMFKAPNGRPGKYTIWLTVWDENRCTKSCTFTIVVGEIKLSCPEALTVCPDQTTDLTTLWNFAYDGVFSGPFVDTEGLFDAPAVKGKTECFPVKFTLKSEDGCLDSCLIKVCVLPLPEIKCPDTIHTCINSDPFHPFPGAEGTLYFKDQPIPNGFSPAEAGVGTHHLYFIEQYGERPRCEYVCKFVIMVHELPKVECPNKIVICSSNQKIELPKQLYPNYSYKGTGVTFESGSYYFNSALTGVGAHLVILIVENEYGCKNLCRFIVEVGEIKIECPDTLWICSGTKENLSRMWNFPYQGTFSGPGTNAEGIFDPELINPQQCVELTYHYENNHCKDSCRFIICFEPQPDIKCMDTIHVCINSNPFQPIENAPGTFYLKGEPLPDGYFNPMAYSEGSYPIDYVQTYGHNRECQFHCRILVVIHPLPRFDCPNDLLVCNTSLEKVDLPKLPYPFYEYSGEHVEGTPGNQIFLVSKASTGIHYISVSVKDKWGCISSCRFRVLIGNEEINCPDTVYLCPGDPYPLNRLTQLLGGGQFISPLVSNNIFIAPLAETNLCYTVAYVMKDNFGCTDSCQFVVCVQGINQADCPDTIRICEDGKPFRLEVKPTGGSYWLDTLKLPEGWFDPAKFGPGIYTVYYSGTSAAPYFCPLRCPLIIEVLPEPRIECPKKPVTLCVGDQGLVLDGLSWPKGGTYLLNGKAVSVFYPKELGKYLVEYHYTDPITGCSAGCEFIIRVNPLPEIQCPADRVVCTGKEPILLSGAEPAGGAYQENGVMISQLPAHNPGEHTLWYVVTDRYTGCTDSCSFKVHVLEKPQIDCPDKVTICSEEKISLFEFIEKPANEGYPYHFSGPGLTGEHNEIVEARLMQQGEYRISYTVGAGNCSDSCSFWLVIIKPPVQLTCPEDFTLCTSSNAINLIDLLVPTGTIPTGLILTGAYLVHDPTQGGIFFDPGKVDPNDYNKPIEITAYACTYYNNRQDSCCSACRFTITVTNHAMVTCKGNIFACEGTGTIDLMNYVSPMGGEFYRLGGITNPIFSLANFPVFTDIKLMYYFPKRGFDCADSCQLTLKIIPFPNVALRDTLWPDQDPLVISNNQVSFGNNPQWTTEGDGSFNDPALVHPTYTPGIVDLQKGKISLHLRVSTENCETKKSMTAFPVQQLQFNAGWSGVSLYRTPVNNILESLVEPIKPDLNMIYNLSGDQYIPEKSILTLWNRETGYIANCTNGSTLPIQGSYNQGQVLHINQGWNLIPVLSYCPVDPGLFAMNNNLIMIKEIAGLGVYWPQANISDLEHLEPGRAYLAQFNSSETVIFPQCLSVGLFASKSMVNEPFIPEEWGKLHKTPISFVLALPLDQFAGENISNGDVIGAFTPEGILAGISEIGLNHTLVLFGDDPLTPEKDGFALGDPIVLKLYKRTASGIFTIEPNLVGDIPLESFKENGAAQIEEVKLTLVNKTDWINCLVYPIPASHTLSIFNPSSTLQCIVTTPTGQALIHSRIEPGVNRIEIGNLRSGMYLIQFENKGFKISKRFIKQ